MTVPVPDPHTEGTTTMELSDEWVEVAARALADQASTSRGLGPWSDQEWPSVRDQWMRAARPGIEAVAPLIAAQALRDAADDHLWRGGSVDAWLTARADSLVPPTGDVTDTKEGA